MTEKITAENFTPLTDEQIHALYWKRFDDNLPNMSEAEFIREVREEEEAVKVLLGLGFDVVTKEEENV